MKLTRKKILIACNDPGGTMACIPVIKRLIKDRKLSVSIFAGKYAQELFKKENIVFKTLPLYRIDKNDLKYIRSILEKEKPDLVFTSTSFGKVIDNAFSYVAIVKKIKTFALIDQWCNYSQRFRIYSKNKDLRYLPDYIGIMDDTAKKEMIAEGFPAKRLIVTGQPYFDSLVREREISSSQQGKFFRDKYGIGKKDIIVVFAAEPFRSGDYEKIGYTDIKIVKQLSKSLQLISRKTQKHITLIIKIHPRDERNDSVFPICSNESFKVILARQGRSTQFILNADIVTGMSSIFLIESFLLGKPTLSIQIGLKTKDSLITNRINLTKAIHSFNELNRTLTNIILKKKLSKYIGSNLQIINKDGKSTDRVISFIKRMIN